MVSLMIRPPLAQYPTFPSQVPLCLFLQIRYDHMERSVSPECPIEIPQHAVCLDMINVFKEMGTQI